MKKSEHLENFAKILDKETLLSLVTEKMQVLLQKFFWA